MILMKGHTEAADKDYVTDEQGRKAGYRVSGRGLLYRDKTGRERLAVIYWLAKLGTKTKWTLGFGVVAFIGLIILGSVSAALDSANDGKTDPPASEVITQAPEVQEQKEISQQVAALYPEASSIWVECAESTYEEGDELMDADIIEMCGAPRAWKLFVPMLTEQFPQKSLAWIDCAASVFSIFTEEEVQDYHEDEYAKDTIHSIFRSVCNEPVDSAEVVRESKALLHDALDAVRDGCRATSNGDSVIPDSCRPTLDTAVADLKTEAEEGLPGVCLDLIEQRFYVIRTIEELGPVVDAATLENAEALIFLGITLYSEDADEGGFAALDARIGEIEC